MTTAEAMTHISEKIIPQLQEFGIESFVFAGYVRDGDGKVSRVTMGAPGAHPAYADGLKNLGVMMAAWGHGDL